MTEPVSLPSTDPALNGGGRTQPSRMSEKFPGNDAAALRRLVADAQVAHVSFALQEQPMVLPIAVAMDDDGQLLLHGSTGSRWLRVLGEGIPAAMALTSIDALVVARSAFESSMHYRSAVLFGHCVPIEEAAKTRALDVLTEALIPGRTSEVRRPRSKELAATLVLRFAAEEWSLKVSDGWPEDPEDDVAGPAWAGVLPRTPRYQEAIAAPDLRPGIGLPSSVAALLS
ncbi:pyridoxamine 5'-phosphate oxidase family protein [Jatrophihabitans telluris]|uniref:Pyridoxamine 5'-phosphate oxidase family protein n=1 Tax=Jatrophihabitans telluris TaxID=2038343 RepID=A0ABY4R3A6_9ACTN|nr:pyridoxamine 5'-phosphate oxidase family protein [Jatrophihabitans telluris]UQX90017.1 pyridoxamine 5'-phosphate oxidase family protein [Jatrophihabitans telluris]